MPLLINSQEIGLMTMGVFVYIPKRRKDADGICLTRADIYRWVPIFLFLSAKTCPPSHVFRNELLTHCLSSRRIKNPLRDNLFPVHVKNKVSRSLRKNVFPSSDWLNFFVYSYLSRMRCLTLFLSLTSSSKEWGCGLRATTFFTQKTSGMKLRKTTSDQRCVGSSNLRKTPKIEGKHYRVKYLIRNKRKLFFTWNQCLKKQKGVESGVKPRTNTKSNVAIEK